MHNVERMRDSGGLDDPFGPITDLLKPITRQVARMFCPYPCSLDFGHAGPHSNDPARPLLDDDAFGDEQ